MRHLALALVTVAVLTACGGGDDTPSSAPTTAPTTAAPVRAIGGSITVVRLIDPQTVEDPLGSPCTAKDGFDDIAEGTQVVIYDNDDKVIATGALKGGLYKEFPYCQFDFTVAAPETSVYKIAVGRRGQQVYTAADLDAKLNTVSLKLS